LHAVPENVARGKDGTGEPEVTARLVAFNGDASQGLEHEPLIIEQTYTLRPPSRMRDGVFFDFCETNGKPYDILVAAALYALVHHFPTCRFASDSKEEELRPGFDLFGSVCKPSGDLGKL